MAAVMRIFVATADREEGGDADADADDEGGDAKPGFDLVKVAGDEAEHGAATTDDAFDRVGDIEVEDLLAAHAGERMSMNGKRLNLTLSIFIRSNRTRGSCQRAACRWKSKF